MSATRRLVWHQNIRAFALSERPEGRGDVFSGTTHIALCVFKGKPKDRKTRASSLLSKQLTLLPSAPLHPSPSLLIREKNLIICFCGHSIIVWGKFLSLLLVHSAQLGSCGRTLDSVFVALNTAAPSRTGSRTSFWPASPTMVFSLSWRIS